MVQMLKFVNENFKSIFIPDLESEEENEESIINLDEQKNSKKTNKNIRRNLNKIVDRNKIKYKS